MGLRFTTLLFLYIALIHSVESRYRVTKPEAAALLSKRSAEYVPDDWSQSGEAPSFVKRNTWNPFKLYKFIHQQSNQLVTITSDHDRQISATETSSVQSHTTTRQSNKNDEASTEAYVNIQQTSSITLASLGSKKQSSSLILNNDIDSEPLKTRKQSGGKAQYLNTENFEDELVHVASTKRFNVPKDDGQKRDFSGNQYKRHPFDRLAARLIGKRGNPIFAARFSKRPFDKLASGLIGKRNDAHAWWRNFLKNIGPKQENEKRFSGQQTKIVPFDSLANGLIGK